MSAHMQGENDVVQKLVAAWHLMSEAERVNLLAAVDRVVRSDGAEPARSNAAAGLISLLSSMH
ncbi:hypothetical protein [Mesorhizobium huakuii]|uniref:Uncharacterized protein n=1 Tax=Mesorhizobium huakuii TaxID=28104 RepID=A0A7G6STM9_9HYPH|nr:hypothetical protein [Mesorhizobium huakuii]QND57861.1 hypothetical protein HB778_15585 [Mesorhizobium huakuii]